MRSYLFFESSKRIFSELTGLFDFVWPTVAALWNLRWQVQGYTGVRPKSSVAELQDRFVTGSGIAGANIRRACIDRTWEQQQEELAKFILFDVMSLYESWIALIFDELSLSTQQRIKQLQFPTNRTTGGRTTGVWAVIAEITALESTTIRKSFYDQLVMHKKNSKAYLDNLLTCYRYFKEARNSIIHNGGIADVKAEQAYNSFKSIARTTDLGVREVPAHLPILAGQPISLKLVIFQGHSPI